MTRQQPVAPPAMGPTTVGKVLARARAHARLRTHARPRGIDGPGTVLFLGGLAVIGLVVPAIAIALHRPHILWTGDRALTELAVRQAAGGHQLLGLGGRFGWRHPGPLWIALLVPAYELTGHAPWSLAVGAMTVHVAMVVLAVAVAARAAGARAAAVVAALAAVYLQATGLVYWTNLWAGYAFAWPMLALLVTAALAATDVRAGWALPAAALLGTLEVQTDVSTVVAVTAIGLVATGLRLRHHGWRRFLGAASTLGPAPGTPAAGRDAAHRAPGTVGRGPARSTGIARSDATAVAGRSTGIARTDATAVAARSTGVGRSDATAVAGRSTGIARSDRSDGGERSDRLGRVPVLALVGWALVLAAWVPPLVEQLTTNPGNLTLLARFGTDPSGGYSLRTALAAVGAALSVIPLGAHWVLLDGFGARLGPGPWWAIGLAAAYLAATAGAAALAWHRKRGMAADLAVLTFTALAAAAVTISRIQGPINFYLLTWMTILPVAAIASMILAVASPPGTSRDPLVLGAAAVAAAVALVVLATGATTHDWDRRSSAVVGTQTALLEEAVGPVTGRARIHIATPDTWPDAAGVAVQLARRGARVEVDAPWVFLFGDGARPRPGVADTEVWFSRAHELPDVTDQAGLIQLRTVGDVDVFARRTPPRGPSRAP